MTQDTTIADLIAALQASLTAQQVMLSLLAAQPAPKPAMRREDARDLCIKAMNKVLPSNVTDWHGWKGTFLLSDAALTALGYPEDGT